MEKGFCDVIISIETNQKTSDGDNKIELQTDGKLFFGGGKYYINYEESEITGFEDSSTSIKAEGDTVTMTRRGRFRTKMKFEVGEKNLSYYDTLYGTIGMLVETERIENALTPQGGRLEIDYSLDYDNTGLVKNFLRVDVRRKQNEYN